MIIPKVAVFCTLLTVTWCIEDLSFPPWFRFGSASSAHQVEGAWNVSDKSENIWDRFTHTKTESIADSSNADVTSDSYYQWRRDIEIASELGLHFYRFSISWSRLLPTGFSNHISEDGKTYYSNLIDGLLEKGIEPVVTLYHWDLPQKLQNLGGWTNPLISGWFAEYARVVYFLYADRVKTWITINEPLSICHLAYRTGMFAPGIIDHDIGLYSHPIFAEEGGWPYAIEKIMEELSTKQGFSHSRLPPFSKEEIDLVKGTYDFYGVNQYTSRLVRRANTGEEISNFIVEGIPELDAVMEIDPNWTIGHTAIFPIYPEGLREQMAWLKARYGDVEIFITENGLSTTGAMDDDDRIEFIKDHLTQILLSIREDGVNVTGYTYWSMMDSFEWSDGYQSQFGLYKVDFTDPLRTRTPRASAHYYKNITQTNSLQASDNSILTY